MNLNITMPLCIVLDFNMFPRSYNASNGPKSPMVGAWFQFLEFTISSKNNEVHRNLKPQFDFVIHPLNHFVLYNPLNLFTKVISSYVIS
jgi:hypothetical protein